MSMFDEHGNFSSKRLGKYTNDLLLVQMLRKGIDVPSEKLDAVENLGEIMLSLHSAEKTLEGKL